MLLKRLKVRASLRDTEPMFVVVIMAIAGTRPVLRFAEACLRTVAAVGRGSVGAWWLAILIVAPLLGSFITEPAAMTIGALLLARQFYALKPSPRLAYATLGLLFVNVSVGGTLTQRGGDHDAERGLPSKVEKHERCRPLPRLRDHQHRWRREVGSSRC